MNIPINVDLNKLLINSMVHFAKAYGFLLVQFFYKINKMSQLVHC